MRENEDILSLFVEIYYFLRHSNFSLHVFNFAFASGQMISKSRRLPNILNRQHDPTEPAETIRSTARLYPQERVLDLLCVSVLWVRNSLDSCAIYRVELPEDRGPAV
mgnify:CR=1 FL=1